LLAIDRVFHFSIS